MLKRFLVCFSLMILFILGLWSNFPQPALAHRPHDVIEAIEISPNFKTDKTILILVRNNIFRSVDSGQTWQRSIKGLNNQYNLVDISLSSQNKSIVFATSDGDGVYKSQDNGLSWNKVNQGLDNLKLNLIKVSPKNANWVVLSTQEKGLYQSVTGGEKWQKILDRNITSITFSADNKTLWVGTKKGLLYSTSDQGKTWTENKKLATQGEIKSLLATENNLWIGTEKGGLFQSDSLGKNFIETNQGITDKTIEDIVISPTYSQDKTLFISTNNTGIFRSNDGGKTWKAYSKGLTKDSQADEDQFKTPHFTKIAISPDFSHDKTLLLAGFNGLFQTNNQGEQWQEVNTLSIRSIISLAISPNYQEDQTVALATYVGEIWVSSDGGKTWNYSTTGLEIPRLTGNFKKPNQDPRRFFDITFSPNYKKDKTMFVSLLWDQFAVSHNQGKSWKIVKLPKAKGARTRGLGVITPSDSKQNNILYIVSQYGSVFRSNHQGKSPEFMSQLESRGYNYPLAFALSPNFSQDSTIYASGTKGIYQSKDAGKTWTVLTENTPLSERGKFQIVLSPDYSNDKTIFVGTEKNTFISGDEGKTWRILSKQFAQKDIDALGISPNYKQDKTLFVSLGGEGLFKSTNGGENFQSIAESFIKDNHALVKINSLPSAGIPLKLSPNYAQDQTIFGFGSSKLEVYKSVDGGNNWEVVKLPDLPKTNLQPNLLLTFRLRLALDSRVRLVFSLILAGISYVITELILKKKALKVNPLWVKLGLTGLVFFLALVGSSLA